MILEISSALMSIVYSGGPCPPVSLRGAPPPHSAFSLGGPCPRSRFVGPHRPTPLFHSGAPAPRSRFVGPHRPTPLFHSGPLPPVSHALHEPFFELLQLPRDAGVVHHAPDLRHEAADDRWIDARLQRHRSPRDIGKTFLNLLDARRRE